jgi:hypothetical protein
MTEPTRSPLCWPAQHKRTDKDSRVYGRFGTKVHQNYGIASLTIAQACKRVLDQLSMFNRMGKRPRCDIKNVIISSDLELRSDGLPKSKSKKPTDPGAAVYFTLDGEQRVIPCDSYTTIEDNLAAVAATIEALRAIERHGSQMFKAAFTGFAALPGPDHILKRSWRDILDYYGNDYAEAEKQYRRQCSKTHPDKDGGNAAAFDEVQQAWKQAQGELSK